MSCVKKVSVDTGFVSRALLVISVSFVILSVFGIVSASSGDPRGTGQPTDRVKTGYVSYQILPGDSLWKIGTKNKPDWVSINDWIKDVKEMNKLKSDSIIAGGYLLLPIYEPPN